MPSNENIQTQQQGGTLVTASLAIAETVANAATIIADAMLQPLKSVFSFAAGKGNKKSRGGGKKPRSLHESDSDSAKGYRPECWRCEEILKKPPPCMCDLCKALNNPTEEPKKNWRGTESAVLRAERRQGKQEKQGKQSSSAQPRSRWWIRKPPAGLPSIR